MAKQRIVGSHTSGSGPLVIGSAATRKQVQVTRHAAVRKRLAGVRGMAQVLELDGEWVVAFRGSLPSTWHALDQRVGVLVRVAGPTNRAAEALAIHPRSVPDKAWKPFLKVVKLGGPRSGARVLFDAAAKVDGPVPRHEAAAIPVKLPPGDYVVDKASAGERQTKVTMYRFRPAIAVPIATKQHKPAPPAPVDELILRDETVALAKQLRFVGTDGGPILVVPTSLQKAWHGVYDAAGNYVYDKVPCDYDRACASAMQRRLVMAVGSGQALVLDREASSYLARPDGTALLLVWVGADEGSHVLEAVLSAPARAWTATKETFTMTGKTLAFLDSAANGKDKPKFVGKLAPGRYRIDRMSVFEGRIRVGTASHDLMASAIRLRPA